jgi:hypothetical protein
VEDLIWIDFEEFQAFCTPCFIFKDADPLPVSEYRFGKTKFDVNHAKSSNDKRSTSIGGSSLNKGNLLMLSKVSEIARRLIPHLWLASDDLKHYLQTPENHLDKLEEIWWLGRFPTAIDVVDRYVHRKGRDVDWRFRLNGTDVWINLEVTRRSGDVTRFVHGTQFDPKPLLADKLRKFNPSMPDEINLVGLTLLGPITRSVIDSTKSWLSSLPQVRQVVDAVLLRSLEGVIGSHFVIVSLTQKASLLSQSGIVQEPDEEDLSIITKLEHVLERRFWPKELQDALPPGL